MNQQPKKDRSGSERDQVERELLMYTHIKQLYNIEFQPQIQALDRKLDQLRQTPRRFGRHAI